MREIAVEPAVLGDKIDAGGCACCGLLQGAGVVENIRCFCVPRAARCLQLPFACATACSLPMFGPSSWHYPLTSVALPCPIVGTMHLRHPFELLQRCE